MADNNIIIIIYYNIIIYGGRSKKRHNNIYMATEFLAHRLPTAAVPIHILYIIDRADVDGRVIRFSFQRFFYQRTLLGRDLIYIITRTYIIILCTYG